MLVAVKCDHFHIPRKWYKLRYGHPQNDLLYGWSDVLSADRADLTLSFEIRRYKGRDVRTPHFTVDTPYFDRRTPHFWGFVSFEYSKVAVVPVRAVRH